MKHKVETTYTKTEAKAACKCGWSVTMQMGCSLEEMNRWIKAAEAHVPIQGRLK